jgi:hypothetical protein
MYRTTADALTRTQNALSNNQTMELVEGYKVADDDAGVLQFKTALDNVQIDQRVYVTEKNIKSIIEDPIELQGSNYALFKGFRLLHYLVALPQFPKKGGECLALLRGTINIQSDYGYTPLMIAAWFNNDQAYSYLLCNLHADATLVNYNNETAAWIAKAGEIDDNQQFKRDEAGEYEIKCKKCGTTPCPNPSVEKKSSVLSAHLKF